MQEVIAVFMNLDSIGIPINVDLKHSTGSLDPGFWDKIAKLYTSLLFWFGLIFSFYFLYVILGILTNPGELPFLRMLFLLWMMPFVFIGPFLSPFIGISKAQDYFYYILLFSPAIIWALEIATMFMLRFRKTFSSRTVLIIGTVLLLLLITQFISCIPGAIGSLDIY
jgi:hypothetical protein